MKIDESGVSESNSANQAGLDRLDHVIGSSRSWCEDRLCSGIHVKCYTLKKEI